MALRFSIAGAAGLQLTCGFNPARRGSPFHTTLGRSLSFRSTIAVTASASAALALALAACSKPPQRPQQTPEAGFVVVRTQPAALTAELPGRTTPFAISEVRPQVNGIITERLFTEGSNVRKGQPLYRIDPAPYAAAVNQAKAQLASVQANLATLKLKAE